MSSAVQQAMETKKAVRVWVDGCFDMMHFGHSNALRQAKSMGDVLVVGVHSDAEILKNKGPPVFTEEERYEMARSIRWVDEVIEAAPYVTFLETLEKYNCDFCAHGDDITLSRDGSDCYAIVKAAGKFKEFKRTTGVSTTDIVGRMLLATKDHHDRNETTVRDRKIRTESDSPFTAMYPYVPNILRISQFSECREPAPGEKIVYVPGSFDIFHAGHVSFLKKVFSIGTYIIVGLYSDKTANELHGMNYPIMNIHERLLSVLACRYVSNVVFGAPLEVTETLLNHFRIDYVAVGALKTGNYFSKVDHLKVAKERNILKEINSHSKLTTKDVIDRIIRNRLTYEDRNQRKTKKEVDYLAAVDGADGVSSEENEEVLP